MTRGMKLYRGRSPILSAGAVIVCALALASWSTAPPVSLPAAIGGSSVVASPIEPRVVFALNFDAEDSLAAMPAGAVTVSEQRFFGGTLSLVDSYAGGGKAMKFPATSSVEKAPGVGLVAMAAQAPLPNPRTSEFSFGADILLDSVTSASAADNGDNILQRGLASDPSQFKLQVDQGVPSCSVTGSAGRLLVKGAPLRPATWYGLTCIVTRGGMTMKVIDLMKEETKLFVKNGLVGSVAFSDNVPLAVGRKVGAGGQGIKKQPDQFNGTMDSVWVAVADTQ